MGYEPRITNWAMAKAKAHKLSRKDLLMAMSSGRTESSVGTGAINKVLKIGKREVGVMASYDRRSRRWVIRSCWARNIHW